MLLYRLGLVRMIWLVLPGTVSPINS